LLAEEAVYAYQFEGKRYDCGSKLGYLQATVEYALNHSALGREFEKYLLELADARRKHRREESDGGEEKRARRQSK
jgi:UTP-glucose-1-phosphate uridylyltransferase